MAVADMALPGLGGAADDLGLGGDLQAQVTNETEEQRKKRMAQIQQQQMLGASGSMAVTSLLGPRAGMSGGSY